MNLSVLVSVGGNGHATSRISALVLSFRPAVPCLAPAGEATTQMPNIKPARLLREKDCACARSSLSLPTFIPLSVNDVVSSGFVCIHMCFLGTHMYAFVCEEGVGGD